MYHPRKPSSRDQEASDTLKHPTDVINSTLPRPRSLEPIDKIAMLCSGVIPLPAISIPVTKYGTLFSRPDSPPATLHLPTLRRPSSFLSESFGRVSIDTCPLRWASAALGAVVNPPITPAPSLVPPETRHAGPAALARLAVPPVDATTSCPLRLGYARDACWCCSGQIEGEKNPRWSSMELGGG